MTDDLKLIEQPGDGLQQVLNSICASTVDNFLKIISNKCLVIHFWKHNSNKSNEITSNNIHTTNIFKDFGLLVNSDLKFLDHVDCVRENAFDWLCLV